MISTAVGIALVLAIGGWFLWADHQRGAEHEAADAAAYAGSGPPCPRGLTATSPQLRHSFEFGDMTLSYASGGTDCADIKDGGGQQAVCKFDSPGSLGVTYKGVQSLFSPGIGKSAMIVRQGDRVSCVMIARIG
jgi:hypothetical protein